MDVLILFLVCLLGLTNGQSVNIECIPLRDCPELRDLVIGGQAISEKTLELLRRSHCGFVENHPKVYCAVVKRSECRTLKGEQGKCVPISDCNYYQGLLSSAIENSWSSVYKLLQRSQCNDRNPNRFQISVCCPNENVPVIINEAPTFTKSSPINLPIHLPRPNDGTCGQQTLNRIIGGKVTDLDEFPWTALLEYRSRSRTSTACAGSLINDRYVVTAAHCVDSSATKSVGKLTHVILGEFDTRNETDCINQLGYEDCADPPLRIPIEEITIYPQWYKKALGEINHDIALIRLAQRVRFTNFIQPICLPWSKLNIKKEENLVVTGWGRTEKGIRSFVKLKTTLSMADRNFCVNKYQSNKRLLVGDGEICVGGKEGKDSCTGDSGGPLMMSVDGVWLLVGIVSFGATQPCGAKDFPGLYTFVPKYVEWIYETVRP